MLKMLGKKNQAGIKVKTNKLCLEEESSIVWVIHISVIESNIFDI
jgi:hypothetical protein